MWGWLSDRAPVESYRLWDTGTSWLQIEANRGWYDWRLLDRALETASAIQLNQPAAGPGKGTFLNTFTSLAGTFGADAGPAMAASSKWVLDNPIGD